MIVLQLILYCLLFTAVVALATGGKAGNVLFFYPKPFQERAFELGLADREVVARKRKRFMPLFFLVMTAAMLLIIGAWNGVRDFKTAYLQALLFLEVMNWYDGIVIDRLWVGHSKFWVIPGMKGVPLCADLAAGAEKTVRLDIDLADRRGYCRGAGDRDFWEVIKMNWLRILLDSVIICIAFNGVVAFVWLLEPIGFSVMLPEGINTPRDKLTKAQLKPLRLMEFILYPILLGYIILSTYEAGVNGFWNLFWTAYIENLAWNFGDFFLLDWLLRAKYTDRLMVPGTEDCEMWKTGPWMKKFGIMDHWVKGPILCIPLALLCAGLGLLLR